MQTATPMNKMPLYLGKIPMEGGIVIPVQLVFDGSNTPIEIDLNPVQFGGHFSGFQTFYVDNEANAQEIIFNFEGSQQRISIPSAAQSYMPVLQPNPPKCTVVTNAAITIMVHLINFFLPPAVWNTGSCCVTVTDGVHTVPDITTLTVVGATVSGAEPNATITIAGGATGANPTATAGPTAVNGAAATFMRSDGAPAIQLATNAQKGIAQVDGTTITAAAGVISAVVPAGANPTATAGPTAVNGAAATFMRSDGAPAIQLATNAQKGIAQVDGTTITAAAGVISAVVPAGANPTATAGPTAVNGAAATFMRSDGAPAIQKATNAQFGLAEGDGVTITAVAGVLSAITTSGGVASYTEGTWTPADLSGAGLAFTINSATYTKIGRQVTVKMDITYPATASGLAALISGFPFASSINSSYIVNTSIAAFTQLVGNINSTFMAMSTFVQNPASITNANLSGGRLKITATYVTA